MSEYGAVKQLVSRVISFPPSFARIGGSVTAGIFLAQLGYWTPRADADGWVFKTQEQWEAETTLTRREQETARRNLRSIGVLEEKREGVPPRSYYRINIPRLCELLAGLACSNPPEQMAETASMNGGNRQSSILKITPEITPEILSPTDSCALTPEDLIEAWNTQCGHVGLPMVKQLTAARRRKALLRIREHPDVEFWSDIFYRVRTSSFLLGNRPTNGHEHWTARFDWLIDNDTNIVKVAEGQYDDKAHPKQTYLGR